MLASQLKSSILHVVWKVGIAVFEIFATFIRYGEWWLKLMGFLLQSFAFKETTATLFTIAKGCGGKRFKGITWMIILKTYIWDDVQLLIVLYLTEYATHCSRF